MKTRFKLTGESNERLVPCFEYPNCKCKGHFVWEDKKCRKQEQGEQK